jgi:hypothetical protein
MVLRSRLAPALLVLVPFVVAGACSATGDDQSFETDTATGSSGEGGHGGQSSSTEVGGGFGIGGSSGVGGAPNLCKVQDEGADNALPTCDEKAPAESFDPQVQWTWTGPAATGGSYPVNGSISTPLVGNFTDDNGDGAIDLCDIPDILVATIDSLDFGGSLALVSAAKLHMLAGDTGALELTFPGLFDSFVYPAFGDLDGDGLPEILAADTAGHLVAYSHNGTLKWTGDKGGYLTTFASAQCTTIGIYDLDGDGKPEILFGWEVFDNQGHRLWGDPTNAAEFDGTYWCVTPTAADLDGDGKLEVLMGHETYHHDGTLYWKLPGFKPAHPQVGNLDDDPEAEVFLTNADGISIVEHDGTVKLGPVRPTDPIPAPNCWGKPAVIHDFDGDGKADIAAATCTDYSVYKVGTTAITPLWIAYVQDISGLATATAFDFLGDGVAEAIYADETLAYVFDGLTGDIKLSSPRQSGTVIEYPVVADIDNDGSAEIVYTSNYFDGSNGATVTVLRDAQERWIPARRIWNQYSYHVTNVREDGTIPKVMKKSWQSNNTFRTNSQISVSGMDCSPEVPN